MAKYLLDPVSGTDAYTLEGGGYYLQETIPTTPTIVQTAVYGSGAVVSGTMVGTFGATPTVGNLMLALVSYNQGATVSTPTGWTVLDTSGIADGGDRIKTYYRVVQAGDGTSYTFTTSGGSPNPDYTSLVLYEITGQATTGFINGHVVSPDNATYLTTWPTPAVTPSVVGCLAIAGVAPDYSNIGGNNITGFTTDNGWTIDRETHTNTYHPIATAHSITYDTTTAVNANITGTNGVGQAAASTTILIAPLAGVTRTATQSAIGRVAQNINYFIVAKARAAVNLTKTQTAIARIVQARTKTQTATARVAVNITKTQTAIARVAKNLTKTQTAISRIATNPTKTQTATARVATNRTATQTAIGRIVATPTKTQTATARVATNRTKTQTATARAALNRSATQAATAHITTTRTATQTATARIRINTVTATELTTNGTGTDATAFTTASVTPTANALVLAWVYTIAAADPNHATITGAGLTWSEVASIGDGSGLRRLTLLKAQGVGTAGTLTIDFAGQTQAGCDWSVIQYTGVASSGAVVQAVTNFSTSLVSSLAVTLGAFSSTDNATAAGFGVPLNTASTAGTGYTQTGEKHQGSPNQGLITEFRIDNDLSPSASFTGAVPATGIAVEIKAAASNSLSQPAIARIAINQTNTQPAIAAVAIKASATQPASARVATNRTKTQTAIGRVAQNRTATQSAKARISQTLTKTQTAIGRISRTLAATQTAIARVATNRTKTQTAIASIAISTVVTKTQTATARIAVTATKTQTAIARIVANRTATQTARARIAINRTATQPATARVATNRTATQTATARIVQARTATQTATGRVAKSLTKTQTSIARVATNRTASQSAIASIAISGTGTKNQTAIARIAVLRTKTQTAIARIVASRAATQLATARAAINRSQTQTATARAAVNRTVTQTATARVYRGLVAWYKLDGNGNDSSGNGFNGSLVGAPTGTLDRFALPNAALSFTTSIQNVTIPDNPAFAFGPQPFTVSAWINFDSSLLGQYGGIISQGGNSFEVNKSSGNNLRVEMSIVVAGVPTVMRFQESFASLTAANTWYHVVANFDPATGVGQLWVNGASRTITYIDPVVTGTFNDSTSAVYIGQRNGAQLQWKGALDDIRVYDRTLSSAEVAALYTPAINGTATQQAKARIAVSPTKTQTAIARIATNRTASQTATARLVTNRTATQTARARIVQIRSAVQTAIARVVQNRTKTQAAIGRVATSGTKTQTATAKIVVTRTATQSARARIVVQRTATQTATARIVVIAPPGAFTAECKELHPFTVICERIKTFTESTTRMRTFVTTISALEFEGKVGQADRFNTTETE